MTHLALLHHPCFFIDASVAPALVSKRALSILQSKIFKVDSAIMEGLEPLLAPNPSRSKEECAAFAAKLQLRTFSLD
jgi:hypothetical protein